MTKGLVSRLQLEKHAYAGDAGRPVGSFAAIMGTYGAFVAALAAGARAAGCSVPDDLRGKDIALAAVATHKVSRLIAKDPVASPLRMPFTRFAGTSGEAELAEDVRGSGARKALGELVTCPFCLVNGSLPASSSGTSWLLGRHGWRPPSSPC